MPKYKINYSFDGYGEVIVKAKDKETAEEMFDDGDFGDEKESGTNYVVDDINEIN
jgi:hypothetical protein